MKILKGETLAKGFAGGAVCLYQEDILAAAPKYNIPAGMVKAEIERLRQGIESTKEELKGIHSRVLKSLSATEAEIFYAHIIILEDLAFIKQMENFISDKRVNSEWAVISTIEDYKKSFGELPGDYIRERADDLNDIAKRIISNLGYRHTGFVCTGCQPSSAVVASEHLTTSLISSLGGKPPAGIIIERGSEVSHGAIMARAMGVPVIIKVYGLIENLGCGTQVIIDADRGRVYISPGEKTRRRYQKAAAEKKPFQQLDRGFLETADGERVKISVNASGIGDIKKGLEKGVADVGLFRTEFLFTGRMTRPSVGEQEKIYAEIIKATEGETAFRLLDAGTDKEMPYLNLPRQDNPDLGFRGVRIYRRYPEILDEQTEALLRAKKERPVKIIVPMVSVIGEFTGVRKKILEKLSALRKKNPGIKDNIQIGCMLELPSAVHTLDDFIRECDFLSVGTNDLIQYLAGADRSNDYLPGELSDPLQPAVASVLKLIFDKSRNSGKEVSVCGEMAGSPRTAELLIGLGYRSLSMNPANIEETAEFLRGSSTRRMRSAARALLHGKPSQTASDFDALQNTDGKL